MNKKLIVTATLLVMAGFARAELASPDGVWSCEEMIESQTKSACESVNLIISGSRYIMIFSDSTLEMQLNHNARLGTIELVPTDGINKRRSFVGTMKTDGDRLKISYAGSAGGAQSVASAESIRNLVWKRNVGMSKSIQSPMIVNSLGMQMHLVYPGTFIKGSAQHEFARIDEAQQRVTLRKPFFMGAHEVTVGQFAQFVNEKLAEDPFWKTDAERGTPTDPLGGMTTVGTGIPHWNSQASWRMPGFEQTADHPAVFISWNDAQAFCDWLSKKEGRLYRLPTEAEWEYAARAGAKTAYWWGDDIENGAGKANVADLSYTKTYPSKLVATRFDDQHVHTAPVGSFMPNPWGFYDMVGNAYEWVSDLWSMPTGQGVVDPQGPATGEMRIAKGGAWGNRLDQTRAGFRYRDPPNTRFSGTGFRVAISISN